LAAHHIRIMDGEIMNGPRHGVLTTAYANSNEFIRLAVHGNGRSRYDHGFYLATDDNLVENCVVYDNAGAGIHVYKQNGSVWGNTIRGNRITRNGNGVILTHGASTVSDNLIDANYRSGIRIDYGAVDVVVANNRISGNREHGIYIGHLSTRALLRGNRLSANISDISDFGKATMITDGEHPPSPAAR
jgi:parallel beta-helix repeat protein